jgi:pyrimidine operon attenuation protein/uracil phosphoribosyltransferase
MDAAKVTQGRDGPPEANGLPTPTSAHVAQLAGKDLTVVIAASFTSASSKWNEAGKIASSLTHEVARPRDQPPSHDTLPVENPSHPSPDPPQSRLVATIQTIGAQEIHTAITRLATAIAARHPAPKKLLLLGIANGGVTLAHRLAARLSALGSPLSATTGTVDISFHRDDIGRHPIPKEFAPTHIPSDVHGATIILVDDVLFSGRTVKAALDELFDHGRPAKVELAVLVDRGGRLMPVAADYTGLTLTTAAAEKVVVTLDPKAPARDSIRIQSPTTSH